MFEQQLLTRLEEKRALHLYRTRGVTQVETAPEVMRNGKRCLSFCNNDYLGLSQHPAVIAAFTQAAQQFGVGSGASAVVSGYSYLHQALEEELAEFTQRPRALLFSTGYMANVGIITALVKSPDKIFADRLNHASLMDASRFSGAYLRRYSHADVHSLKKILQAIEKKQKCEINCGVESKSESHASKFIVTDGVFSVDGDIAPLTELAEIARENAACLIVDDSHGFGVLGDKGEGSVGVAALNHQQVPILTGAFGKAFGTFGAFVAGSEVLIESIIQFARSYVYTTALPPALVAAMRASLKLLQTENWRRVHLQELIRHFRKGAEALGLQLLPSLTPIQPILIGSSELALRCGEALLERNILVGVMRPPTVPPNSARLRVTLSVLHSVGQVDYLLAELEKILSIFITRK